MVCYFGELVLGENYFNFHSVGFELISKKTKKLAIDSLRTVQLTMAGMSWVFKGNCFESQLGLEKIKVPARVGCWLVIKFPWNSKTGYHMLLVTPIASHGLYCNFTKKCTIAEPTKIFTTCLPAHSYTWSFVALSIAWWSNVALLV